MSRASQGSRILNPREHEWIHVGIACGRFRSQAASHLLHPAQRGAAKKQTRQDNHVVLGTCDRADLVLILIVEAVKENQLLVAVSWVVKGIDVQRDLGWFLGEGLDKAIDKPLFHLEKIARSDCVFQS